MKRYYLALVAVLFATISQAQVIKGKVVDQTNLALPGASVVIKGTTVGSSTDMDGNYTIKNIDPGTYTLQVKFLGFKTQEKEVTVNAGETVTVDFSMSDNTQLLKEAVVIGYGTAKKEDLTGALVSIGSEDFQDGNVQSPDQLVMGKVAGVNITASDGSPGAGGAVRIRGGASLNASNNPLYVIDGVPLEVDGGIAGLGNPLAAINPNDIENITVLKDASATAIYGSRASNGVIIVTTKKGSQNGGGKLSVEFNTNNSISVLPNRVDVFTADELREYLLENDSSAVANLGDANTDWQEEIYRPAFTTDNILTVSGGIKNLPYRLSVGYLDQSGVLETDNLKRTTANLNLNPSFFDDRLKLDIGNKLAITNSRFADRGAIGGAVVFDPTQPVRVDSTDKYGGFYEWETGGQPNTLLPRNPVALIEQKEDNGNAFRYIGNYKADYTLPFLPELTLTVNGGIDYSKGTGTVVWDDSSAAQYNPNSKGRISEYEQTKINRLLDAYFVYNKELTGLNSNIKFTGGYSYQDFFQEDINFRDLQGNGDTIPGVLAPQFPTNELQNTLIGYFGRLEYSLADKYLFTATMRADGSSKFAPDYRWGFFPSAAFAWKIGQENFMSGFENLSEFKLRLGWGQTGQQEVGNRFNHIYRYQIGQPTAQYQFGDQFYTAFRPEEYDPTFQWETSTTYNAGIDYGFYNGRIYGSLDWFLKQTRDLQAEVNIPTGTNFANRITTNIGEINNWGIEAVINVVPISTTDMSWEIGANFTLYRSEITKLQEFEDSTFNGIQVGGIDGQIGNFIQIHSVGQQANTFFVFEQLYDAEGNPIEPGTDRGDGTNYTNLDAYVDQNNDSIINDDDLIHFQNPNPQFTIGFTQSFTYKKWTASMLARLSYGNYVYNNFNSKTANLNSIVTGQGANNNGSSAAAETGFENANANTVRSDYWIENATFFRFDNLSIGYNYGEILKGKAMLRLFGTVQNLFVISQYSGLDPEVFGGIDANLYPRPTIFSLGANIRF